MTARSKKFLLSYVLKSHSELAEIYFDLQTE